LADKQLDQNVPPVWRAVQFMWSWLDIHHSSENTENPFSNDFDVEADSEPWWEEMVGQIFEKEGKLNLA